MYYVGLMSGTSADSIDAVVMEFPPRAAFRLLASHQEPLPDEIRDQIHQLAAVGPDEIGRASRLSVRLGRLFARAAEAAIEKSGVASADVRAIGCHGQTVRHRPDGPEPFTVQIGEPAIIAESTGITTIANFRARDIAAGGQGAPLVPGFHRAAFRSDRATRAIVNIGGIANATILPKEKLAPVVGFDTGPGNTLMDQWAKRHRNEPFDRNGEWAAAGRPAPALLARLLSDAYFSRPPPKSTGREHFNLDWLAPVMERYAGLEPKDVQATLLQLTAASIANALSDPEYGIEEVYVCGGGAHNPRLMDALAARFSPIPVKATESLGLPAQWVEAAAFAWLAHETLEGRPGNLPSVTGARHEAVLGAIYPA